MFCVVDILLICNSTHLKWFQNYCRNDCVIFHHFPFSHFITRICSFACKYVIKYMYNGNVYKCYFPFWTFSCIYYVHISSIRTNEMHREFRTCAMHFEISVKLMLLSHYKATNTHEHTRTHRMSDRQTHAYAHTRNILTCATKNNDLIEWFCRISRIIGAH